MNEKNLAKYKVIKIKTKVAIGEAELKAFNKLDSKEGEKHIHRMRKMKQAKTTNIAVVECIKDNDKDKNILVQDRNIKDR